MRENCKIKSVLSLKIIMVCKVTVEELEIKVVVFNLNKIKIKKGLLEENI